jgi:uncharacterized protein (DUF1800 family)
MLRKLSALFLVAALSACASSNKGSTSTSNATPSPPASTPAASAGTLAYSTSSYSAAQNAGSVTITVTRTNGSSGAVGVSYSTASGSAVAGTDFTAASGTLSWADGDSTARTITVTLASTTAYTGSKSFTVTLSNVTGGATLAGASSVSVMVNGTAALPPTSTGVPMGQTAAARLLGQATFGATLDTIAAASTQSYDSWFANQAGATPSFYLPLVPTQNSAFFPVWLKTAVTAPDQLRQRVAFALSEILVVSASTMGQTDAGNALAAYYDILVRDAFGNYRTLLNDVTLSPEMGLYLSTLRNNKPNPATGVHADENYAREVMQLFSVGLVKLNPDGSVQLDANGQPIPTYSQADVENLARVFTGWSSAPTTGPASDGTWQFDLNRVDPMVAYENHHDTGAKTIIGGVSVPAGGTCAADLKIALDTLFNHPNVGPFIGKQLIQRLVTSNPSAVYVQRVANVFNNNGSGVRGDLLAVVKAILTDPEAVTTGGNTYGKLREPLLRVANLWRAFNAVDSTGQFQESSVLIYGNAYFEQQPLDSPSVFNFFRPDYERAGVLTNAGMVAPEFQITNENTLVLTENELARLSYQFVDSQGKHHAGTDLDYSSFLTPSNVMLHTAQWEVFAATPSTLVEELNLVFMAGQMTPATKTTLVNYVSQIPASTPWTRVAEAASLLLSSPQYAIQR